VGDRAEYGSADAFAEKIGNRPLDVSRLSTAKEIRYTSTRGAALRLQFVPGGAFPKAWIDGMPLDFDQWPVCESPFVTCRNGVLDANDGKRGFTVDWSGEYPVYTYYDLEGGRKKTTGVEWLDHGVLRKK
jgi:hypothetical protein